jgi:serine/threonine protein kinase
MESLRKEAFENSLKELNVAFLLGNEVEKIEKVGEGGFGEVFRGKYGTLDVAIKQIKFDETCEADEDNDVYKILLNEIKVMLKANSPDIPKFFGIWKHEDHYHLIFEFIFGKSFKSCFNDMDKVTKLKVVRDFLGILADFHEKKLIHRDVKPDNIMIETQNNRPRLIDFGVSKIARKTATFTKMQMGTVPYMSPEMYFDEDDANADDEDAKPVPVSTYCDIWSTGVMMSEIFSGVKPWNKNEKTNINEFQIQACMVKKVNFPIPSSLDDDIKELIEAALHLDYTQRPSARQLQMRIDSILEKYK